MITPESTQNQAFDLANEVVKYTTCNLFLTGKAGTGKTTFLKQLKQECSKNMAIVAPTGVAAINAGGVTMHSFFQLPFNLYMPNETNVFGNNMTVDRYQLLKNLRFNREKIELLAELELLIIDEVSMVRADALQAINDMLQHVRRNSKPFGGVQLLLIGDLYQLPPVVDDVEQELMKSFYPSPFFFSAPAIKESNLLFIELKKVYRQNEGDFLNLLNNIRNNNITEVYLNLLQSRYNPNSTPKNAITLTTHNRIADSINTKRLAELPGKTSTFEGSIRGDFSEKALPTEMDLVLKPGAQIMFIKNDPNPEKQYYNGKLATVKHMSKEAVRVEFLDDKQVYELEKVKWTNVKYTLNKETNKIEEEELGSFTQYPIRLAWAITIHKSQGLTFDEVIIDAGQSFAAGQVYVALSRCRTLEGITLLSRIAPANILADSRIVAFAKQEHSPQHIEQVLATEKPKFAAQLLLRAFDWSKLLVALHVYKDELENKKQPDLEPIKESGVLLVDKALAQQDVADKFLKQLDLLLHKNPINDALLTERVTKAKAYFAKALNDELIAVINSIQAYLKGKTRVKALLNHTNELEDVIWKKLNEVQRVTFGNLTFAITPIERVVKQNTTSKTEKVSSKHVTLDFYKQGMSVLDIAKQRGVTTATIEGHLADFVHTADVNVFDFITPSELKQIEQAALNMEPISLSAIKQQLGDTLTFSQVKMGLNHLNLNKTKTTT